MSDKVVVVEKEDLTVGEALTWWQKNKKWVWPAITGAVMLFGGNVDRISEFLPDLPNTEAVKTLEEKVDKLQTSVTQLQAMRCTCQQAPAQPQPPVVVEGDVIRDYTK
jgi:hypothetical protein